MTRNTLLTRIAPALAWLVLAGCTVQIDQTPILPTPVRSTATATAAATATSTATPVPIDIDGEETDEAEETPAASATATTVPQAWYDFPFQDDAALEYEILPGWESLGLEGSLVFLAFSTTGQSVVVFDFETGRLDPIFIGPQNTWVLSASLHPSHGDLLLSYAPVPPEGETQYGYTDLYRLSPDGSLVPLLERTEEVESFFSAFYTNEGDAAIYSWFVLDESVDYGFRYHINRLELESGDRATLIEDAFWQTLSADDRELAYVTLDPNAAVDDPAELRILPMGGGEPVAALDPAQFPVIDAPFFSTDGRYLYFSAVSEPPPALSWLDILTGVTLASAHNVPSDWWRTDLETGEVLRITELFDQGMFGVFSPGGDRIAFISASGLWVMNPDGGEIVQVISSASFYGNIQWVP